MWAVIPHAQNMNFLWALRYGKGTRSFQKLSVSCMGLSTNNIYYKLNLTMQQQVNITLLFHHKITNVFNLYINQIYNGRNIAGLIKFICGLSKGCGPKFQESPLSLVH